jgi:predicted nucleic acid-binding protein
LSIVVSDTSPIRALSHLGLLDSLSRLFTVVYVPPAVLNELKRVPRPYASVDLSGVPWIQVHRPSNEREVLRLKSMLGDGEAEAIALAMELGCGILIDEERGRKVASRMGLVSTGALGILLQCKARGWVAAVGPLMDRLEAELVFRISPSLREKVLRLAGEAADK